MKSVCVLGSGQLGRMLRQAGEPLGIAVHLVGLDVRPQILPHFTLEQSVITTEIENWPKTELTSIIAEHDAFVNRDIFPLLTDRLTQKQLLDRLGFATTPWQLLSNPNEWRQIFSTLGSPAIVKRRIGGYDGHGQWRLRATDTAILPADCYGQCIVEKNIDFSSEVSLIGARGHNGDTVFYPLTYNLNQDNILRTSIVLPQVNMQHQQHAECMLSAIMDELNYIGVMVMECFVAKDKLLINELAPRVHNSGHWTQNGASISQFELHLRAILNIPLPKPVVSNPAVMVNLIGTEVNINWLQQPLVHLHWYEKEVYSGRKVGHLNLSDIHPEMLSAALNALIPMLPDEYNSWITWAVEKLS